MNYAEICIIKRDGKREDFSISKIKNAIGKAFSATGIQDEQQLIADVTMSVISQFTNPTITVEEIQDLVEKALMKVRPEVAKKYIIYREWRNTERDKKTQMKHVMDGIVAIDKNDVNLSNANMSSHTPAGQMMTFASEVTKDYTYKYLLPKRFAEAHQLGDIHIHDLDFLSLTTTCCQIDIKTLFKGGFGTGHGFLREPNDIRSYSALACIAIQANQNDQHGGQSIPNFEYGLAPGVAKTFIKELCLILDLYNMESKDAVKAGLQSLLEHDEMRACTFDGTKYIYLPDLLSAEQDIAARLGELATFPTESPKTLESDIRVLELTQGFEYAPLQREAIRLALSSRVMVLTGGPGTGKTTTVKAILNLYEGIYDRVALCAPTGRAAKRLTELTGHSASTIHRLLEVDYSTGSVRFIHNEKNLLPFDVIILDEMSMVDAKLFQALLAAARYHCRIIMVGDADQLPSVGPGSVLGEILQADVLPTVRLNEIFRQAQKSMIVQNAHRIVEGQMPIKGGRDDDFFMIESTGLACQRLICDLVSTRLPKSYGYDPVRDIQVLCPTKVGPTGSVELNRRLQAILNPPAPDKPQIIWEQSGRVLRCGDKVMQIKNDYDIPYERDGAEAGVGAYNGDMGIITAVDPESRAVTVQMDDRKYIYGADQLAELEPAYAVTVHKSQGSEFPAVIMPVADVPARLCYRNLLYTGVTRARRLCILAGTRRTEQAMVDNVRQNMRYSGLRYLLREAVTPAEKRR